MSSDVFIDLSKDGTLLRFDAVTQRLKVVEVYNAQLIRLRYNREVVWYVEAGTVLGVRC